MIIYIYVNNRSFQVQDLLGILQAPGSSCSLTAKAEVLMRH